MKTANEQLAEAHAADPESVNVEHVEDEEAQHIEMVSRATRPLFFSLLP